MSTAKHGTHSTLTEFLLDKISLIKLCSNQIFKRLIDRGFWLFFVFRLVIIYQNGLGFVKGQ